MMKMVVRLIKNPFDVFNARGTEFLYGRPGFECILSEQNFYMVLDLYSNAIEHTTTLGDKDLWGSLTLHSAPLHT